MNYNLWQYWFELMSIPADKITPRQLEHRAFLTALSEEATK